MKRHLQTVLAGVGMLAITTMPTFGVTHVSPRAAQSPVTAYSEGEKGTQNNPFYVEDLLAMDLPDTEQPVEDVWLEGYIVGWVSGMFYLTGAQFEIDPSGETVKGNIIIGPSEDETDPALCMPVQLPSGAVRNELNLNANPDNLGKHVKIHGQYAQYFGRRGFKQVDEYEWVEAETPDDPSTKMYVIGSNVNGAEWELASPEAEMTMTSPGVWEWSGMVLGSEFKFNDGSWEGEYNIGAAPLADVVTLDVPQAVINDGSSLNLTFGGDILEINKPHIVLNLNTMEVTVSGTTKVSQEYFLVGDFNEWVLGLNASRFELQTNGSYKLSNYTISGDGELSGSMAVATMGFAEKYGIEAGSDVVLTPGREINLVLSGENLKYSMPAGKYDVIFRDGDTPTLKFVPIFAADKGALENPFTVSEFYMMDVDNTINNVWLNAYIVGWVAGAAYDSGVHFELGADDTTSQTNILVAVSPDVTDAEACIPIQLPNGAVRSALNLKDNPGNLGKQVLLRGDYTKYFGRRGLKNTSKYEVIIPHEPVTLKVTIDGGAAVSSLVNNNEEMTLKLAFDDEYWQVSEVSVNGENLISTPSESADVTFNVSGDTAVDVKVAYKGKLEVVENSGVVELTDTLKIGIENDVIFVEGLAAGDEVVVYNMSGMIVGSFKATESRMEITLEKGQAYVVRVADKAVKAAL